MASNIDCNSMATASGPYKFILFYTPYQVLSKHDTIYTPLLQCFIYRKYMHNIQLKFEVPPAASIYYYLIDLKETKKDSILICMRYELLWNLAVTVNCSQIIVVVSCASPTIVHVQNMLDQTNIIPEEIICIFFYSQHLVWQSKSLHELSSAKSINEVGVGDNIRCMASD